MSKIYIVYHGVHYEGTDNICAFTSEKVAKDFVAACEAHHAKKPGYPCGEYDEKVHARYTREDKRWRKALPGGEASAYADFFGYHDSELHHDKARGQNK